MAAFAALLTVSRLLFSGSTPVMAVAKNVLTEATRMKISVIFIVLVVFGLAALPLVLDPEQPLRYRVQSFLQYATAGSFWAIAILVLVFSVSSVATEQRDKVIWQTMTKPVAAWQYILGKWLGVCTLAAVLLLVCTSGIFMFSEYLRTQPATGESQAYVATSGRGITEDRLILETQVLTSRTTVRVAPIELDNETFRKNVQDKVETEMRTLEQTIGSPDELKRRREALRTAIADSLRNSINMEYHSIRPGTGQWYRFEGLAAAKTTNRPIILRFKLDSGSNRPDAAFKITLQFMGSDPQVMPIGLGQFHTLPINPQVIDENGNADLQIINADVRAGRPNPETLAFSPEGLEISYSSGGFRANFMRCALVLWIKLAFLAMLAICASTFLSFSIAALVSFAIFLAAEGAGFVSGALENYMTEDSEGKTLVLNTVVAHIAGVVATTFKIYADLRPTGRLVEGLELSLLDVASGAIVLAAATGVLYMIAVYVFRRRELAIYSGN